MVWSSWGKSWGGGTGTSETIIVDSFGLDISMEEVVFEDSQEFEVVLDSSELSVDQDDIIIFAEEEEFDLEMEVENG